MLGVCVGGYFCSTGGCFMYLIDVNRRSVLPLHLAVCVTSVCFSVEFHYSPWSIARLPA